MKIDIDLTDKKIASTLEGYGNFTISRKDLVKLSGKRVNIKGTLEITEV